MEGIERSRPVEVLARAARAVHGPVPRDEKLAWAAGATCEVTGADFAAYIGFRPPETPPTAVHGIGPAEVDAFVRPVVARLLGRPEFLGSPEPGVTVGWQRLLLTVGPSSEDHPATCLVAPVPTSGGRPHGALLCGHRDPDRFGPDEEAALMALASHLGVALDNLVTMNRLAELEAEQREAVHQLQEAVRPPVPAVEAAELGVHYLPADPSAPTGGDLYDWMVLPDGDLHLAVVDVMGKGVAATKDAVSVTHAIRMLVLDGCPIERVVARADALVTAHNPDLVATVVLARYRPADGVVMLAGGGQPPPLLVSGTGRVRTVPVPGMAIGWPGAGSEELVALTLGRNDALILYTDGLIEANKNVLSGLDRLAQAAAQTARYPAEHLARALVERSLAGAVRRDDSVALVLRRRIPPAAEPGHRLRPFEYRFSPNPATIPLGRHLLADWLDLVGVEEADRPDVLLIASELCSNAVRHASGAPGALRLRARAEGDAVVVEVEDDGTGFDIADFERRDVPDPDAEDGRGLYVVRALADEISACREDGRTVVRATRQAVLPPG
jgi:serine phosphatase RsbU (regulator of sigma subunit)/anti-sigma regulatory factor (Ser/Thr protein kinase)